MSARSTDEGASLYTLSARQELADGKMRRLGSFPVGEREVTVLAGRDSLWALIRKGPDGGILLRAACALGLKARVVRKASDEELRVRLDSALGVHVVSFSKPRSELDLIRVTARLTPTSPMLVPFLPRDLYLLGPGDDPLAAVGRVEAAQRGLNTGLCYLHLDEPRFGSVLYMQNLTALNPYFESTDTKPDGAVGGEWPELGYLPPTPPQSGTPPKNPLPAGRETVMSDALLVFHDGVAPDEQRSARLFLQMLGSAYRVIDKPSLEFHNWPERAVATLRNLEEAPEASVRHYRHVYVRPYVDAEYPDSMVQMSLLASIRDYTAWSREPLTFECQLAAGLDRFFDKKLGTIRRYLPNVGDDKNADAVDSWYLYHPLLNMGRMALDGDERCRRLFLGSIDFAIKAARHFDYAWPIQYNVTNFDVIVAARNDDGLGQTDVGGIYAYVMLQAYELTAEERFLHEARAAIDAAQGMRFELNYQANLTAWGASACMRLWRITNEEQYLRQSYVYLASFFHNTAIWESDLKTAKHFHNFLGVTALHDGPYMALYECFDSFAAMERYLKDSGPDLDPAARLLIGDYCRYALDRAWFYYPDTLPSDILCQKPRNGHIDQKLSFPLEDLYIGGDIAGQVGQEVYGAGAAFIFTSRSFHRIDDAPFQIFCDHFMLASDRTGERSLAFQLGGEGTSEANMSIIPAGRSPLSRMLVSLATGPAVRRRRNVDGRMDYVIPADARVEIRW